MTTAPVFVLDSAERYEVAAECGLHRGQVLNGNVTVQVLIKPANSSSATQFQLISEEQPPWVSNIC